VNFSPLVIMGARSDIGRAIARRYAESGYAIVLAARNVASLEADRKDLEIRYRVPVSLTEFDLAHTDPDRFFASLETIPGTVIMVAGFLGVQSAAEIDDGLSTEIMYTNYVGPARFLLAAARVMEQRERGCIIGISSVAGDRGRKSNFVYGSAKAGFTAFLSGLRNRLDRRIHVITVKPGYVATRMTAGMKLPQLLTAQPDEVARAIFRAQMNGYDMIYVRPVWRLIMLIIRFIPEKLFKRLSF
jgi:decaprenylphospho-beta-D-erythro-pentofuranosid-2-ulose 2-reductase